MVYIAAVLFPFRFKRSILDRLVFFYLVSCDLIFCYVVSLLISRGGEMEAYIKFDLIGGGSPRYLGTFSNLLLYTTHLLLWCYYC